MNVFELIKEKIADQVYMIRDTYGLDSNCTEDYIGAFEEIVDEVAEEYKGKYLSKDEVGYMLDTIEMRGDETWMDYYRKALKGLCELSGGKYNNGWIPCSERLPEESLNSVIGWDEYRNRCCFVQYYGGRWILGNDIESVKITAWMPLPEPYQQKGCD